MDNFGEALRISEAARRDLSAKLRKRTEMLVFAFLVGIGLAWALVLPAADRPTPDSCWHILSAHHHLRQVYTEDASPALAALKPLVADCPGFVTDHDESPPDPDQQSPIYRGRS